MKYAIVYINPENEADLVYFLEGTNVYDFCSEKSPDFSSFSTRDKNKALKFDSIDDAKSAIYALRYYHRDLLKLKTGIQKIECENLSERKENNSVVNLCMENKENGENKEN